MSFRRSRRSRESGMPWGLVVTTVAQVIARGEDTRDIDNAVRSWRQTHPQGART